jgi:hypothetical protein
MKVVETKKNGISPLLKTKEREKGKGRLGRGQVFQL